MNNDEKMVWYSWVAWGKRAVVVAIMVTIPVSAFGGIAWLFDGPYEPYMASFLLRMQKPSV